MCKESTKEHCSFVQCYFVEEHATKSVSFQLIVAESLLHCVKRVDNIG